MGRATAALSRPQPTRGPDDGPDDGIARLRRVRITQRRMENVARAVRSADQRYAAAAPDSQGMTRAEYVGRAAIAALYAEPAFIPPAVPPR